MCNLTENLEPEVKNMSTKIDKRWVRENYLNALDRKPTRWQPIEFEGLNYGGFEFTSFEKGSPEDPYDGFGVKWERPKSFGGAAVPAPNNFVLKDISDWKDVQFPDLDAYDWEGEASMWKDLDRSCEILDYGSGNGHFERLAALMGFENALMAMAEDPDEVEDFFKKLTEFKIEVVRKAKKYFNPDTFTLYDDTATQRSPFMSPDTYRELIMPYHKLVFDACKEEGIRPSLHCCGYAQPLVECFIEEGALSWTSVQPCNDIAAILKKYGDKICITGGYDTNGSAGVTEDPAVMKAEIQRCFDQYGKYPGYIFCGACFKPESTSEDGMDIWEPAMTLMQLAIEMAHKNAGIEADVIVNSFTG